MMRGARNRSLGSLVLSVALLCLAVWVPVSEAKAAPGRGRVLVVRLEGAVTPILAEALDDAIDRAEREDYTAVLVELDTPGGLDTSMRDMVKRIFASRRPVLVWIGPSGARAASAGVFITLAADVAAMAPGTHLGAATPVHMQGPMDSTMARKATHDAAAYARAVARQRGRNAEWAERAVRQAVSASDNEAVDLRIVDFIATSPADLLDKAHDRDWWRDSTRATLATRGLPMDRVNPGFRQRVLGVLADPNVAYILLMIGFYGILFELQNPGAILPGILGGIALVLAFFALSTLPVNFAGIALLLLAVVFFVAETQVASHGMLGAGGVVALLLGSLFLFHGDAVRVSWPLVAGATLATAAVLFSVIGLGLAAQRRSPQSGPAGMIGERGVVIERLAPAGRVRLGETVWNAVSREVVEAGAPIEVAVVEGLTLHVRPVPGAGENT